MTKWPHLLAVTVVYWCLNVSKYMLNLIFCAYLFMFICVLFLLPLLQRDDLVMVYVYEYVLRNVGSKNPQVSYEAVYHGFSVVSGLHCRAHIPIIVIPKVAA